MGLNLINNQLIGNGNLKLITPSTNVSENSYQNFHSRIKESAFRSWEYLAILRYLAIFRGHRGTLKIGRAVRELCFKGTIILNIFTALFRLMII